MPLDSLGEAWNQTETVPRDGTPVRLLFRYPGGDSCNDLFYRWIAGVEAFESIRSGLWLSKQVIIVGWRK